MKYLKHYSNLKAGSILESVISIIIISICSLVAFTIYLNVIKVNTSFAFYKAEQKTYQLMNQAELTKNIDNDEFVFDTYKIEKRVELNKNEHIAKIDWLIITNNKSKLLKTIFNFNEQ